MTATHLDWSTQGATREEKQIYRSEKLYKTKKGQRSNITMRRERIQRALVLKGNEHRKWAWCISNCAVKIGGDTYIMTIPLIQTSINGLNN